METHRPKGKFGQLDRDIGFSPNRLVSLSFTKLLPLLLIHLKLNSQELSGIALHDLYIDILFKMVK